MSEYRYKVHMHRGYALVKSTYGGMWHVHETKNDEINMFRELGFARTLGDAKKIVDEEIKRGKKKQSKKRNAVNRNSASGTSC